MKTIAIAVVATGLVGTLTAFGLPKQASAMDIHTDILIHAAPDEVWSVLADNRRYGEWNPYHVEVEGTLAEGETLDLKIDKPDGTQVAIRPHVMRVVENRELVWGGGIRGLFRGVHVFELQSVGPRCTRLIQRESFDGIFVRFASLGGIEDGYNRMNQALKRRVEGGNAALQSGCPAVETGA
ncbi:SRPBCC domain-containing protein [Oricola sp.]|uniref:SRPBCC domain-containing protein n=1 Tax=Oricola sp. TaxID=1979950 RepID=UPI0025E78010|nr:SRPBCC domain-containing protein [Oricola sp.]MCI5077874.1 SRPBCC domain-containing protein [Oricola sp.]